MEVLEARQLDVVYEGLAKLRDQREVGEALEALEELGCHLPLVLGLD